MDDVRVMLVCAGSCTVLVSQSEISTLAEDLCTWKAVDDGILPTDKEAQEESGFDRNRIRD